MLISDDHPFVERELPDGLCATCGYGIEEHREIVSIREMTLQEALIRYPRDAK